MNIRRIRSMPAAVNPTVAAIFNTPLEYLMATLALHCTSYGVDAQAFLERLVVADWEVVHHDAVRPPAIPYRTRMEGHVQVMSVRLMRPDDEVVFDDPYAKRTAVDTTEGGTGVPNVMGTAKGYDLGPASGWTYALVGPSDEDGSDVLWTVHAGEPVAPSRMPTSVWAGKTITAREAIEAGVEYVRIGRKV